jgi:hypothetical protein
VLIFVRKRKSNKMNFFKMNFNEEYQKAGEGNYEIAMRKAVANNN